MTDRASGPNGIFDGFFGQQLTRRSVFGLAALGALLAIYGMLSLIDIIEVKKREAAALSAELLVWEDSEAQNSWRRRAVETTALKAQWETFLWSSPSAGIAAAEIELVLREVAMASAVGNMRVDVSAIPLERNGRPFLRFELAGAIPAAELPRLMVQIAAQRRLMVVDDMQVTTRQETSTTFRISGVAPLNLSATESK